MRGAIALAAGLLLGGCVSAFPEEALRAVNRALSLEELRRDPAAYVNQRVLLGGEILATRPRVGETEIEVLSRRLRGDDTPERSDRSDGRFLVKTPEFLDPAVYAEGRRVTVVGRVTGGEERTIGELPYRYPVIAADRIRLWPRDYAETFPPYPRFQSSHSDWPYMYYGRPYHYRRVPFLPPPYWW